ncbi:hypothetical protein [Ornithinibacillus halotolerans]|uniref:YceG-like family protein n=1 Tax=Ornithinibacillus halotolerans TaxID=1274357 RepID=A0A916RS27_9BACI|nr:hypothetical protein [Ornithinibacillus halotolerans]GGA68432.1 hypothetical protein GCM10008025_10520 [Ornithinibacillus halotolerans]
MKQTIRGFAVGLFTAAVIMLAVNYFTNGTKQDISEVPIEHIVEELKDKGYRVLTEDDYISLSISGEVSKKETEIASDDTKNEDSESNETESKNEESSSDEDTEENNQEQKEEVEDQEEKETTKTYTVSITSGMAPSTISKELESNGIIENADEFITYLEDEGYVVRIQLGEFTIASDMSFYEIAEALTK